MKILTMEKDDADEATVSREANLNVLDDAVDFSVGYDPGANYTKVFVRLSETRSKESRATRDGYSPSGPPARLGLGLDQE